MDKRVLRNHTPMSAKCDNIKGMSKKCITPWSQDLSNSALSLEVDGCVLTLDAADADARVVVDAAVRRCRIPASRHSHTGCWASFLPP